LGGGGIETQDAHPLGWACGERTCACQLLLLQLESSLIRLLAQGGRPGQRSGPHAGALRPLDLCSALFSEGLCQAAPANNVRLHAH
jgi:hypothetical protein